MLRGKWSVEESYIARDKRIIHSSDEYSGKAKFFNDSNNDYKFLNTKVRYERSPNPYLPNIDSEVTYKFQLNNLNKIYVSLNREFDYERSDIKYNLISFKNDFELSFLPSDYGLKASSKKGGTQFEIEIIKKNYFKINFTSPSPTNYAFTSEFIKNKPKKNIKHNNINKENEHSIFQPKTYTSTEDIALCNPEEIVKLAGNDSEYNAY